MTTITINKDIKLSKTHFEDLEELQEEILVQRHLNYEVSEEHKRILDEREKEADNATDNGLTWEEVKANLKRRNG